MPDIYKFENYRDFLKAYLEQAPRKGHGLRRKWAEAAKCHSTFISQVLAGNGDLSPEQGAKLIPILGLNRFHARYFLTLINFARAGDRDLKKLYHEEIQELRNLSTGMERLSQSEAPNTELARQVYFSSAIHQHVHLALTRPGIRTVAQIARYLGVTEDEVNTVLDVLLMTGAVKRQGESVKTTSKGFFAHINAELLYQVEFLMQMRLLGMRALDKRPKGKFFFHRSLNLMIARDDFKKIRDILEKAVTDIESLAKSSPEEDLFCVNFDLFEPTASE